MNTRNNKRAVNSRESIEKAFLQLVDSCDTAKITVQAICKQADINRTTFYAHYTDILDLQKKIERNLSEQIADIFEDALQDASKMDDAFCELFRFIREHQVFYKAFLKYNNHLTVLKTILNSNAPGADNSPERNYHVSFFTAGVSEMVRIWLNNYCRETPEEMARIIYEEYCRV